MIRQAFEFIAESVRAGLEPKDLGQGLWNVGGQLKRTPLPYEVPRAHPLEVTTLDQVVAYVNATPDEPTPDDFLVNVESPTRVQVGHTFSTELDTGREARRWNLVALHPSEGHTKLIRLPLSDALAWLKSACEETPDGEELLKLLSDIAMDDKVQIQDKGAGQRITVETSVGNTEGVEPKRTYELAPFVTFHEIEQPRRPYTVRVSRDPLEVTLTCADGGAWKTKAVTAIRGYLAEHIVVNTEYVGGVHII